MWATPFLLNSYFSWVSLCVIFSVCHNCVNAKYHDSWYIYMYIYSPNFIPYSKIYLPLPHVKKQQLRMSKGTLLNINLAKQNEPAHVIGHA